MSPVSDYSNSQKFFHKIALSYNAVLESAFDFDRKVFLDKHYLELDNHVFISGLARSGSTVLLNAIYRSNEFASLSYDDMPFILAPNFWSKISGFKKHGKKKIRAHEDRIEVSTDSPEAFEQVFWKTFEYSPNELTQYFRDYVALILTKYRKNRYLSKNNQNVQRIDLIRSIFPNSKLLIPFRHPLQQAGSLFSQHQKYIEKQKQDPFVLLYMDWIGHTEFGLGYIPAVSQGLRYTEPQQFSHWIEQWYLTYKFLFDSYNNVSQVCFVNYELLCDSEDLWKSLKKELDVDCNIKYPFKNIPRNVAYSYDLEIYHKCCELYELLRENSHCLMK